jgi:hypothetical protein
MNLLVIIVLLLSIHWILLQLLVQFRQFSIRLLIELRFRSLMNLHHLHLDLRPLLTMNHLRQWIPSQQPKSSN